MKTKLLTVCFLLFTSQVFAETKSLKENTDMDPILVIYRCAANTFSIIQLVELMEDKGKEEMDFQEVMKIRFNFFVDTLINYHHDHNKNFSRDEITEKTLSEIADLSKIVSRDIKKPYFHEDTAFCKSIVKYKKK